MEGDRWPSSSSAKPNWLWDQHNSRAYSVRAGWDGRARLSLRRNQMPLRNSCPLGQQRRSADGGARCIGFSASHLMPTTTFASRCLIGGQASTHFRLRGRSDALLYLASVHEFTGESVSVAHPGILPAE